ncbi:hypothetical protein AB205_0035240 [Aquarana catesbeiana]|uniref:Uncharacterized protein n=1 Tax=Aquarana catesbeiana TaxID=8400 RepID=A0A2G9Q7P0_AQUCT|nr:hypothetical protein AB205_0035240 [Aquarana catesbeiana]
MSEVTRDPQPPKEGKIQKQKLEDVEEGIVTTTGDVDVVEETHFTSAQVLIGEIMVCNRDLQKIKTSMMLKKDSKTSLMF